MFIVQHELHVKDPRLISVFCSASNTKRRGAHTAQLRPGDDEYDVIRERLLNSLRASKETLGKALSRMESSDDPFGHTCPGCEEACTGNFGGWDVTLDGASHNTCPVLDKDPSDHVMSPARARHHQTPSPTADTTAPTTRLNQLQPSSPSSSTPAPTTRRKRRQPSSTSVTDSAQTTAHKRRRPSSTSYTACSERSTSSCNYRSKNP